MITPTDDQVEAPMKNAQIKHMVDRFLGWKLPENFRPDAGISFEPRYNVGTMGWPSGTNLFDATQATAMIRHLVEGLPGPTEAEVEEETCTCGAGHGSLEGHLEWCAWVIDRAALTAAFSLAPAGTGGSSAGLGGNIDMKEAAGRDALLPPQPSAALPGKDAGPDWIAHCCECGRVIDTREVSEGGDAFGCELNDGRWTCSADCWDQAVNGHSATSATLQGAHAVAAALVSQPHPEGSWHPSVEDDKLCRERAMQQWEASLSRPDLDERSRVRGAVDACLRQMLAISALHPAPHKAGNEGLIEALSAELMAVEERLRSTAGHYTPSSDGWNTFLMEADWVAQRRVALLAKQEGGK